MPVATKAAKEVRLHPGQQAAWEAKERFVILIAGTGGGKCETVDTQVLMASGERKQICDVRVGDTVLRKNDVGRIAPATVTASVDRGIQPAYELTTTSGRQINLTAEHPLYSLRGWKPVSQLKVNDFIAVPRCYPVLGTETYDKKALRILGYLIGGGGTTVSASFHNTCGSVLADFRDCLPTGCRLTHRSGCSYDIVGIGRGSSSKNKVLGWMKEWGLFGKKSKEKTIPPFVFTLTNKCIAEVLGAYFACDGWIDKHGFEVATASEQLSKDIQHLLLRFGIVARRRRKMSKRNGKFFPSWVLVCGAYDLPKIYQSFRIPGKQEKLAKALGRKGNTNVDLVPDFPMGECWEKLGECSPSRKGGYSDRQGYKLIRSIHRSAISCVTRQKAGELAEYFGVGRNEAHSDIFWDRVKSIEPLGDQPTWDLSVDEGQNFIANDIFSHNTWLGPLWLSREIAKAPDGLFMVIAPTHKLLSRATVPMLKQMFQGTNLEGRYYETKGQYHLPTGGIIYCLSADKPELVEGGQINAAWLDEAGQMTRWIWVVIQARLGLKQGRCLITTTPYAMNWLYTEVYKKWLKRDPNYFVVQFSSTQNPYYPHKEFERMKGELTEAEFAMRYQGEFTQLQGLVYRDFHKCVVPHPTYRPKPGDMVIGGIDPGYSAPTAAITAVRDDKGVVHVQREYYKSGTLIRDIAEHLDPNASYWADPAARREIEELQFYHPNIKSAINDVRPGIMKVNEFIRDGRLVVPEDVAPNMISEAAMYAFTEGKDAPVQKGEHHALDALRYMIMGLEEAGHLDIYFL